MITARYQITTNFILLDFGKPVLQVAPPTSFFVNEQPALNVTAGPTTDSLYIYPARTFNALDDIWLKYVSSPANLFLYLTGEPSTRLINSFSVQVFPEQITGESVNLNNTTLSPVIADFIDAYGLEEAIMISNPDNALAESPDEFKFLRAFEDAEALWNTYLSAINLAYRSTIAAGKRRTILIFARYFLDSRCRRKNVTADFNDAVDSLTKVNEGLAVVANPEDLYVNSNAIIYGGQTCCNICNDNCSCT